MGMRVGLAALGVAGLVALAAAAQGQESAAPLPVGDEDAGAEIYGQECRGCHAVSIAPSLRGLIGRPIASLESFPGYSAGLKARAAESWSPANIDAFLTDPAAFAPSTRMVKSISDPQQRADIIAYIASLPPPRQ